MPFAIYITTSFPEKTAILWWYVLEDIIVSNDEIVLSDGQKFDCKSESEKIDTFMKMREMIISFEQKDFSAHLNNIFSNYDMDWQEKCEQLAMGWEQIVELSKDKLCTIAGHTKNHFALNRLSEQEIIDEVVGANSLIESKVGKKIEHFAYPFGSRDEIGQREFDIIKTLGFKTVTTTRHGTIYLEHNNYMECLPRVMLTENFDISYTGKIRQKRIVTL